MARNWHPVPLHNRDMVDLLPGTLLSGHFVLGGPAVPSADGAGLWRATDVATGDLAQTVSRDVANGMIRPDVGVDFGNFIRPVEADLVAGEPAGVRQLAVTLRAKLAQRVNEDAVTPDAARAIAAELNMMQAATGT
jgi:hypothetical protein